MAGSVAVGNSMIIEGGAFFWDGTSFSDAKVEIVGDDLTDYFTAPVYSVVFPVIIQSVIVGEEL